MNCEPERLVAYALGDLDDRENKALASHVQECRSCAERLVELRATLGVIRALPEAEDRPVSMARLRRAIGPPDAAAEGSRRLAWRLLPRWRWGFALATVAAVALMCFHYGVAVRVGQFEIALGGKGGAIVVSSAGPPAAQATPATNENVVRSLARDEIGTQVVPALVRLARTIEDLDAQHHEDLVGLRNAVAIQRVADLDEVKRNFGLIANTVNETLGGR